MKPVVRRLAYATLALAFTRVVLGGAPAGGGMVGGLASLVAPRDGAAPAPLVTLDLLLVAVLAVFTVAAGGLGASAPATALPRRERWLVRGAALASAALALDLASSGAVSHFLAGLAATALLLLASLALVWAARRADAPLRAASRIACGTILLQLALSGALGALDLPATLHAMNAGLGALVWVSLVVATALSARVPAAAAVAPELPRVEATMLVVQAAAAIQPALAFAPEPVASEAVAAEERAPEPVSLPAESVETSPPAAPLEIESIEPVEVEPVAIEVAAAEVVVLEPEAMAAEVVALEPEAMAAEAVAAEAVPVEVVALEPEAVAVEAVAPGPRIPEPELEPNVVEPEALEQASLQIEARELDLRATGDGDFEESEDLDSELLVVADEVNELAESNEVAEEAGSVAEETGMVAVPDDAASPVSVVAPRRPPTLAVLLARGADF